MYIRDLPGKGSGFFVAMRKRNYELDMCSGALLPKILLFSLPLILSSILQLLFNAADVIVVGKFAGDTALAAVGSTGSLINLLTNLFVGLSIGANVLVARYYASRDYDRLEDTIHTSVMVSLIGGVILVIVGLCFARPLLLLMGTPSDVIDQAVLYMMIYFLGMPVMMLYNFGSAILRAVGDTRRPLYFLMIAGVLNVVLNLLFVIVFSWGVAGVAAATVLSQCVSTALIVRCLMKSDTMCRLEIKKLCVKKAALRDIARIGLPAGLQGCVFSLSNVLIQSSINSFGSTAMAGSTAAANIEGFVYVAMNSFYQAAVSFTSQNMGGRRYGRINRILLQCLFYAGLTGIILGIGAYLCGDVLLGLYTSDPQVIVYGMIRLSLVSSTYAFCGLMDVFCGILRGMGYGVMPMVVSLAGACGLRILWICTVFQWSRTLEILYLCYAISWIVTTLAHLTCFLVVRRRWPKKDQESPVFS